MTDHMPATGDIAPDFTLPQDGGDPITLSTLAPAPVVLYFYPKDDTPGCTAEACTDVCERYGTWGEKKNYGRTYMGITRATFLIGPDGKIAQVWPKVKVKGHAEEVLAATRALVSA